MSFPKGNVVEVYYDVISPYSWMAIEGCWNKPVRYDTLNAQCFLTSIELNNPKYLIVACQEVFKRMWLTGKPVHQIEHLKEAAVNIGLPDADKIISAIGSPRVKETLKKRTHTATDIGAFGTPWIIVKRPDKSAISFFGMTPMAMIVDLLKCSDPLIRSKI
ncbi:hypothetical protein QR680_009949 [Steinernema hermaphroditum]|uniref:DSBA-like thioredoxin domain-containing protein n=1 Tax=Steinernema hermaphroditum TaxID=289476 RepID=A0AA39MAU2_9BILA|nr:hypothetical protein QR680_009949 [Steinernema hermaphroditum]